MIQHIVKLANHTDRIRKKMDAGMIRVLFHRAASLRKATAESIDQVDGPSAPGQPVHTHRRAFVRRAYRFHVDKRNFEAVIGPRASVVGDVMGVLEKGGTRGDQTYEARPTIGPQLEINAARFAGDFAGVLGG